MSLFKDIKDYIFGKTLYFPGCVTKYQLEKIKNNYQAILKELGIEFVTLEKEFCCGLPALNKGYVEDFERLRYENIQLFKKNNISKIITNCPACASMFKEHYNIDAKHVTEVIPKQDIKEDRGQVSYHDPCHLARNCNIINQPRELLESIGFKVVKNNNSGKNTLCCGTGHIDVDKPQAKNIAEMRMKDFSTQKVITTCPLCYKHMKNNAEEKEVCELSEVIMR
ncbi:MAG: (Fe-S)-binding protein [Candidatus Woesearchaeota archaeon]